MTSLHMQQQTTETMETFLGHIKTPQDALIIFEACRRGQLVRVKRRLSTKERMSIRSGSVFAFDENEAGMRRWTDGRTWSPSRVSGGSFLTYRELDTKRRPRRSSSTRHLSCSYKPSGLIKQSFSICTASNQKMHLISYYAKSDVIHGRLSSPSMDPLLGKIVIPKGLYPELNPLDTSGGHSATLHLMMMKKASMDKQQDIVDTGNKGSHYYYNNCINKLDSALPPSLSSSPLSSCSDDDFSSTASSPNKKFALPSPPTCALAPFVPIWKPYSLQSEDTRQLEALKTQLRI
ncbi:Gti1/Pac2 family-domain-containing protein [Chlamydoabsidia padenii]|nr:Gti1/Pac2 family-domain-containing protein [Chlamydoabsidia padenii]